ncbi:PH domain-containing protein [Planctomycetota bacterium]
MQTTSFNIGQTKQCPFCAETIRTEALKCRFCGEFLDTELARTAEDLNETDLDDDEQQHRQENILFQGRPSLWGLAPVVIKALFFVGIALVLITQPIEIWLNEFSNLQLSDARVITFGRYRFFAGLGIAALVAMVLFLKILKLKMTYYEVDTDRIEWSRGILDRRVDNLDMFRVIDLKLRRSLIDCFLGIGTVGLVTTDKSDPEFVFQKIHRPRLLYDAIKKASLEADNKRSVIHLE